MKDYCYAIRFFGFTLGPAILIEPASASRSSLLILLRFSVFSGYLKLEMLLVEVDESEYFPGTMYDGGKNKEQSESLRENIAKLYGITAREQRRTAVGTCGEQLHSIPIHLHLQVTLHAR